VIACDQYTSQPEYWQKVEEYSGDGPSTLNLIFPEVFLDEEDRDYRIRRINKSMERYIEQEILVAQKQGFILVNRKTSSGAVRNGLIVALDLEHYDYCDGSRSLIRSTEGTILDRLPPRIMVRENASLEASHIMVLIDDPEKTVIEPLLEKPLESLYDMDLMMNGGHIEGYMVDQEPFIHEIAENLTKLADPETFSRKYDVAGQDIFLYAMGDGNHSFATAKAIWEKLKKNAQDRESVMNHPARYCLVELVNVYDEGLAFEPIHRVVFGVNTDEMLLSMKSFFAEQGSECSYMTFSSREELDMECRDVREEKLHRIIFVAEGIHGVVTIRNPRFSLEAASLQTFLDAFVQKTAGTSVDYIHGDQVVSDLGSRTGNLGFYLPALSKHDLFRTIILDGALPRKTFSMGTADEKRFYLECRKIR
jgi:uncharacterized protein (DUF1015 family)